MIRGTGALLVGMGLLLTACAEQAAQSEPAAPSSPPSDSSEGSFKGKARFTWQAPLTVRVTESTTKTENRAETSYWLDLCPAEDKKLSVAHRGFEFVSLNGVKADDPRVAPSLAKIAPLFAAIPVFVIERDGRYSHVLGIDDMLARMAEVFDEEDIAKLRETLDNDAARAALEQGIFTRWAAWVAAWLDVDLSAGAEQQLPPPEGSSSTATRQFKYESTEPGRVKLSLSTHLEGEELKRMLGLANEAFNAGLETSDVAGHADNLIVTETSWPELRPYRTQTSKKLVLRINGEQSERTEDHVYVFDWESSKSAKPECAPASTP